MAQLNIILNQYHYSILTPQNKNSLIAISTFTIATEQACKINPKLPPAIKPLTSIL